MPDSIDFDDISGDVGVDLASRAFTKNQGESLSFQFSYKQEGIDQALNGIYSVSHFTKLGEDLITFGRLPLNIILIGFNNEAIM